ncbi:hypothetical protein JHD48_04325 [Sulfurimonas sp. SAG-AH-194-I05]|nr:hypothetical protein [Sulfurimonas sp. SAG-AH-194-I05]MDF1874955.1 hypothetical protein [Sulfurimonas sp. SAG-AH-194-I05]
MKLFSLLFLLSSQLFSITLNPSTSNNSLIVYNSNVGLVHEKRTLKLQKNDTTIVYKGVASSINTDSVNVTLPKGISLYSQQYRFDKLTQDKLLRAHIGKSIRVKVRKNVNEFQTIQAKLLSHDGTSCIVKNKDSILIVESKNIIFDTVPKELITKPSLVWNVKAKKNIHAKMSIDYLMNNIKWKSNYILHVNKSQANLVGWINIDNRSGKAFKNTSLHVLAGDINRVRPTRENYRVMKSVAMAYDGAPQVAHQAHEGYHFYTIPFKVNLANNEKTQIKFITQNGIAIQRKYTSTMNHPNYLRSEVKHGVTQHVTMQGFDFVLPKGVVRTYAKLESTNILLGETQLQHTPKNTPISLKLGKNFDVKVKETLLNRDKGSWNLDVDVQYTLTNNSDEMKKIELTIPFTRNDGSNVKSKKRYTFTKGNLVTFNINVKAQSTKTFEVYFTSQINK